LQPEKHRILEMAVIITDTQLSLVAEGPVIAIHQPESVLKEIDPWCVTQHGNSGLTERVRQSNITEAEAEARMLAFIRQYVPEKTSPLCGNSICQDRRFLYEYMPTLEAYFHYRHLDVSTVKILAQQWAPEVANSFKKETKHLALDDIRESIEELRHYKKLFFKDPS